MHPDEITSEGSTLSSTKLRRSRRMFLPAVLRYRFYVAVDPETLSELEERASSEGRQLNLVTADALRAGVSRIVGIPRV